MGLLDILGSGTPQADTLGQGLLGLGAGLLSGGAYGAFGPALGKGLLGFQQGEQNAQLMQQRQALADLQRQQVQTKLAQQQAVQNFFHGAGTPTAGGAIPNPDGSTSYPVGATSQAPSAAPSDDMINRALTSGNPTLMQWGMNMQRAKQLGTSMELRGRMLDQNGWSAPVQTSHGFAQVNRLTGQARMVTGADGSPLLPTTVDPAVKGAVADATGFGTQAGKTRATNQANLPNAQANIDQMLHTVDLVKNSPGKDWSLGYMSYAPTFPGTSQAAFRTALDQLKGQTFLQAYNTLRGGGQITEAEGSKATNALARLNTAQSEKDFDAALDDLRSILVNAKGRLATTAGVSPKGAGAAASGVPAIQDAAAYNQLPSGTLFRAPDGSLRRKP